MQSLLLAARRHPRGTLHRIAGHARPSYGLYPASPASASSLSPPQPSLSSQHKHQQENQHTHQQENQHQQKRTFNSHARKMLSQTDLDISKGEDGETVLSEATKLIEDGGRWKLCNDGRGLERTFKFKTFKQTWDFMNTVADQCKTARHHPEWSNVYNKTEIRWTTHNPRGLSTKDTSMARFCDEAALKFAELEEDSAEASAAGADCCGGKEKL